MTAAEIDPKVIADHLLRQVAGKPRFAPYLKA